VIISDSSGNALDATVENCTTISIGDDCPSGNYDCAGVCDGDAVEDCAGECGGSAEVDECGECGGDGAEMCWDGSYECDASDCPDEPADDFSVSFGSAGDGSLEILLSNSDLVAGFQFNIDGVDLTGAEAGDVVPSDWMISSSSTTVLGFSMQGTTISAGSGTLVNLTYSGSGEACIGSVVLSDPNGVAYDVEVGDCVTLGDDCPEGYDECGVCGGDNSSCSDECGVPNGPGADVECWDGSYECDASDCPDQPGGSVDIMFSSDTDIAGFQFNVSGVDVTGAGG